MVDAPDVFQHTVRALPRQIAGAVQALARRSVRMRNERQGRAHRVADIATAHAGPCNTQLADRAQWHQRLVFAEQVQAVVVGRRADGQVAALGRRSIDTEERHVIGAFCRPVGIDQANVRVALQPLRRQLRWHGFAGRQHPAQAVEGLVIVGQHALNERWHAFQHGDAGRLHMCQQALRVMGDGVRHNLHLGPEQRCSQELPHRNVEALRGSLGDHVLLTQRQVRHLAQLVVEHAALLHHHPFWQAGGA